MDRATVGIYEGAAAEWDRRRGVNAEVLARARAFARRALPGMARLDAGCGPGAYTEAVAGRAPVVALDAAQAMLDLVGARVPGALRVRADIEAPPFRDRGLGGAWASKSYLHVPRHRLPLALARLHWALAVDAPFEMSVLHGDREGAWPGDDFPGRFFACWQPDDLAAVVHGAGFTVDDVDVAGELVRLRARRARSLPDTVGAGMRVLVCGLNPSLTAADAGFGFAGASNRFWPAAVAAGLVTSPRRPLDCLVRDGVGMTDLVKRATPRAAELSPDEYREGAERVRRVVEWLRPGVVVFVGLAGWRAAVDRRAVAGFQPEPFGGAPAYVMPSTSGLNASARPADLVEHLRAALALPLRSGGGNTP